MKRKILAETLRKGLRAVADHSTTAAPDRDALAKLADDPAVSAAALRTFLDASKVSGDDRKAVETFAAQLSEEHKWLSPKQLEEAEISDETGQKQPFAQWFRSVVMKKRQADAGTMGAVKLTDVERRANEVGTRLVHYQAVRDRSMRSVEPLLILPRPNNKEYLAFLAKTYEGAQKSRSVDGLSLLQLDAAKALDTYWNELPMDERSIPGTNPKFDAPFIAWLRESSAWTPLQVFLDSKPEALAEAGYPLEKVNAFQTSFKALEAAENAAPGLVEESKAAALVAAARALGEAASAESYPSVARVEREVYFNETNPFFKAPAAYFLAMALLVVALGFQGLDQTSILAKFGRVIHVLGVLALMGGIGLEAVGFYYRVLISGWAPVTNMYETVIWVSAVAAVLSLLFELAYRNTYMGLAGSTLALFGTLLAANVPLLDPNIHTLTPVLRSNYWLTIHVLTEVSSYGAFLLAAMLGLIATFFYLTATYRRSPSFFQLALPLLPGVPLLAAGLLGILGASGSYGPAWQLGDLGYRAVVAVAWAGMIFTIVGLGALAGEVASRLTFREEQESDAESTVAYESDVSTRATSYKAGALAEGTGAVATLQRPSASALHAAALATPLKLDARGRSMQATAARIKPLANFIYWSMAWGVVLITAGTILGGVWADYSWGRFWGWDPKEVWALATLVIYLIPLHGRLAGWINPFALVVCSVVCSMSVVMAWYGVNFVLGVGLHSYGFTEGGGQGVVITTCLALLALPAAAGWRRRLGSRLTTATHA